jgi:Bacterial dnaA protein helix-turn-helix
MSTAELRTAEEVRLYACMVQRRIEQQRCRRPPPPPPAIVTPAPSLTMNATSPTRAALRMTADHYNLSIEVIVSYGRKHVLIGPRYVAFFVAHRLGASFVQIGRVAHRDHSTVVYGCRSIERQLACRCPPELIEIVDRIGARAASIVGRCWLPVRDLSYDDN